MEPTADDIAEKVQRQFDSLPQKRKPQARGNDIQEWVPLSGIVAQGRDSLRCVALGTGMKCLPANKIHLAQGSVLHDWHAEIVAIRSFNRFLLEECRALALSQEQSSEYLRRRTDVEVTDTHFQPFTLKEDVSLHMYCSEAPCGDASMELTMSAQLDATPWEVPPLTLPPVDALLPSSGTKSDSVTPILPGRSYFSELGIVRRKPARPDAPPTLSKSCTDKLSLYQFTSLLSAPASLLISPSQAYISTLILPLSQHNSISTTRAFRPTGRLAPLSHLLSPNQGTQTGYAFHPFNIKTTTREFIHSRRQSLPPHGKLVPSNLSALWHLRGGEETLIGGVLQGRKAFDPRGASGICKKRIWGLAAEIAAVVGVAPVVRALNERTYKQVKECDLLDGRRKVKVEVRQDTLKGWLRNEGDEFTLDGDALVETSK